METNYRMRPIAAEITHGWIARALSSKFRVTYSSGRFGDTHYVIKDGVGGHVVLTQNTKNGRDVDASLFSPLQHAIMEKLQGWGLVVAAE